MSFWSWTAPRTKAQEIEDRKARTNFYRQGTIISGPDKGKYVAEVLGQKEPAGGSIRETLYKVSSAIAQSKPLNFLIPVVPPQIFEAGPNENRDLLNKTEPNNVVKESVKVTPTVQQIDAQVKEQEDTSFKHDNQEVQSLQHTFTPEQVPSHSSGIQTKPGYNIGSGNQMLGWLANTAPAVLAALATGAGGVIGATAAKKIVGDDPVVPDGDTLKARLFGLSDAEYNSIHDAYSRSNQVGPPPTFQEVLALAAPTSSIARGSTIPSADQSMVQLVADGGLMVANDNQPAVPNPLGDNSSLARAVMMRGFGADPKLLGNQSTRILPPNVQEPAVTPSPGNPQASTTSLGQQLARIAGVTGRGVTEAATGAMADAATELGARVLGAAAPAITRLTESAGRRLGGWLANGISSISNKMTRKIVGDDPEMPGTGGRMRKIVGDPPDLASDSEKASAAIAMESSAVVQMSAARLVMEQLLSTLVPVSPMGDKEEVGAAIVASSQPDFTLYNHDPIDVEAERAGFTLWPTILPYCNNNQSAHWSFVATRPPVARVILVNPEKSTPISETPLAASIAPMLVGAPITEYSGALRIKTMRTDFDMLMTMLGRCVPDLMSDGGYSAARPFAVGLALAAAWGMVPGTEAASFVSGVAFRQLAEYPVPLSQSFPMTNTGMWDGAMAWVSLGEYALALNGETTSMGVDGVKFWDPRFTPDKWDTSCAVIPIYREEMLDGGGNVVRILLNMEHPFLSAAYPVQWLKLQQEGYIPVNFETAHTPDNQAKTATPNTMLSLIEGPKDAVLFVVVDMPTRRVMSIKVGTEAVNIELTPANNPANPILKPAAADTDHTLIPVVQAAMLSGDFSSLLAVQLQRLEQQMVTASDRSSAMRLVADLNLRFSLPKTYLRNKPGIPDQIGGYLATYDEDTGLPLEYHIPATESQMTIVSGSVTTASGRFLKPITVFNARTPIPITHRLGRYSSMLHALAMRGMVMWEEEKSQIPIGSIFPMCEVLYEIGVLTAAITDHIMTTESQVVATLYKNSDADNATENTLLRLNKRNRLYPMLQRAFMAGIQYPTSTPNYDGNDFPLSKAQYDQIYSNTTGDCSFARVSWLGLNKYFGGMIPNSPIINLSMLQGLSPPQYQQTKITTDAQQRPKYFNSFDMHPNQTGLIAEASKLSLSAVPDMQHINPAIYTADFPTTTNITPFAFPVTPPDASWSRAVAYSIYAAGEIDMRTECSSLPIGAILPLFKLTNGSRRRYFIDGYSSLFRMPGGTAAIRIITSSDTPSGLVDADLFPGDYPWLYSSGGGIAMNK